MSDTHRSAENYSILAGSGNAPESLMVSSNGEISIMPSPPTRIPAHLESEFFKLAKQWREETQHVSNFNKALAHPAYQQIIGMGRVLPLEITYLLLRDLEQSSDHWFVALIEINGIDPALGQDTVPGAVRCWLEWGQQKGILNAQPTA